MPVMMSSAAVPVKNIPGIAKAIPGSGENRSPSRRNHCSPSARNPVRLHPGIVFTFTPESFSPCPGIRTKSYGFSLGALNALRRETEPRLIAPIHYHQQEDIVAE